MGEGAGWRKHALCPFCQGMGRFFYLKADRPAWWPCQPCGEVGVLISCGPKTDKIGAAQAKFLKPYPEPSA